MTFEDFARIHGLIINHVVHNKSVRVPTEDKPRKTNGSYKFLGDVGFVMNFATMDKPAVWFDKDILVAPRPKNDINKLWNAISDIESNVKKDKASKKAGWIMKQTKIDTHPYLAKKGFSQDKGYVWVKDDEPLLVVPMSVDKRLVGCQLIKGNGDKKFLYGQTTKNAVFTFDAKGMPFFCEGYATALSLRQVLKSSNIKYCIYVCFSASNMKLVARSISGGLVIADNDANGIGEKTAINIGKSYWISDTIGQDFNDFHISNGDFKASQSLKKAIYGL
jgi:putative DNA primase/helicase